MTSGTGAGSGAAAGFGAAFGRFNGAAFAFTAFLVGLFRFAFALLAFATFFPFRSAFSGHCMLMQITQGLRPWEMTLMMGWLHSGQRSSVGTMRPLCGSGCELSHLG